MGSIINNSLIVRRHRNGFVRRPVYVRGRTDVGTASPVDDRGPLIGIFDGRGRSAVLFGADHDRGPHIGVVFEDRGRSTVLFAADHDRRIRVEGRDPEAAVTEVLRALFLRPKTVGISAVNGRRHPRQPVYFGEPDWSSDRGVQTRQQCQARNVNKHYYLRVNVKEKY